jgi:hypothetical protein
MLTTPIRWVEPDANAALKSCSNDLFASPQWATVMSCLGARCWHGFGRQDDEAVTLFVWRKGFLSLGYLGFPVTPAWAIACSFQLNRAQLPVHVDLLRLNASTLDESTSQLVASSALPEGVIPRLDDWPLRNRKKIKKDLAFATGHGIVVRDSQSADDEVIDSIYRETIVRSKGRLRYNKEYFRALIELAHCNTHLQVRMACHEARAIGFCVAAMQHDRGYYLHAGVAEGNRRLGAADVLANDAIQWAISCEAQSFSLMASPQQQSGLQNFKKKWSESDTQWLSSDHSFGVAGWLICTALKFR